ncbi:MAG TPA: hypothetical protein VES60_10835, partial [Nakamurella sp.]|nr:hypothetical protein [Nakamurella sp.]
MAGRDGPSDGEDELPETSEQTAQLPTSRSDSPSHSPSDSPSDSAEDSIRATAATSSSTSSSEATSDQLGATEPHNLTGSWQPPPPAHIALPGVVLDGRYRLEQMLGRGATAEVFRGTDDLLKRSVAIKVFHQ